MQLISRFVNENYQLSRSSYPQAHHYKVMAMSQTFAYLVIAETSELKYDLDANKDSLNIRYKIIAESKDGIILGESNEIDVSCSDIEKFKITALNGYNGTTLVFRSKGVYNLYKIYDKNALIAETEDPILGFSYKITKKQLNEITVEGYIKIDNDYILGGISDGIKKIPERKKSDYKISVVIPVYNAQFFLPRTVDSVLSSSMSDIEIILVNDGSKDDSLEICKWYAKNFSCVSFISQQNQGLSAARNNGKVKASGEYIGFVDSDDIVHPLMYENLYNTCKSKDVNIAIATTVVNNDINNKEICLGMPGKKETIVVYTYDEMINNIGKADNMYFVSPCNKIVKRKISEKVRFPVDFPSNVIFYEDNAYTPTLYSYIDKFALCKDAYYIWDKRQRKTVGTLSTRCKGENVDNVRKAYIYTGLYPIYNRCDKHKELSDYMCFKQVIQRYDKFTTPSSLLDYWNEKLSELINKQKLYENTLIMHDNHLKEVVEKFNNTFE